jgi:hypothetical protein
MVSLGSYQGLGPSLIVPLWFCGATKSVRNMFPRARSLVRVSGCLFTYGRLFEIQCGTLRVYGCGPFASLPAIPSPLLPSLPEMRCRPTRLFGWCLRWSKNNTPTPDPHPKRTPRGHTEVGWRMPPGGIGHTIHRIAFCAYSVCIHRIAFWLYTV